GTGHAGAARRSPGCCRPGAAGCRSSGTGIGDGPGTPPPGSGGSPRSGSFRTPGPAAGRSRSEAPRPRSSSWAADASASPESVFGRLEPLVRDLLPERLLEPGPEPECPLDPAVVGDPVAVLQVHRTRVQRPVTLVVLVLEGHLAGGVQECG